MDSVNLNAVLLADESDLLHLLPFLERHLPFSCNVSLRTELPFAAGIICNLPFNAQIHQSLLSHARYSSDKSSRFYFTRQSNGDFVAVVAVQREQCFDDNIEQVTNQIVESLAKIE